VIRSWVPPSVAALALGSSRTSVPGRYARQS
jgi:hypothetical protein